MFNLIGETPRRRILHHSPGRRRGVFSYGSGTNYGKGNLQMFHLFKILAKMIADKMRKTSQP